MQTIKLLGAKIPTDTVDEQIINVYGSLSMPYTSTVHCIHVIIIPSVCDLGLALAHQHETTSSPLQ